MRDDQAIARLNQGDLGSMEVLVSRYYLPAVRTAFLIVQDMGIAEDVVQNAFLNLSQIIGKFDPKRPFGPWFFRCVVNAAINTNHRESRLLSLDQLDDTDGFSLENWLRDQADGPAEQVEAAEQRQAIWQALAQLSPKQRAAVVLRYYLELNESEMSAEMDCPKTSLKWWLHSAKARLRQLLNAFEPVGEPNNNQEERL